MRTIFILIGWLVLLVPTSSRAGSRAQNTDPSVPTPFSVLGFRLGDRPVRHGEILTYFEKLAASTPRARLVEYAKSHEGRRLVYLTVSAERNMARLEDVRRAIQRLGDPRGLPAGQANGIIESTPAVAWLGYTIHGGELSGSDAAVLVAYRLCAGRDPETERLRKELVVHIDPLQNPDGRERHQAQMTSLSSVVPNPDTASISHSAFWPWGRWNHYWFDLNRDYLGLIHPETRGRVKAILAWLPQLMVDAHEMWPDTTFLFSPPRHPFNPHLPKNVWKWIERFAHDHAEAFDSRGWSYYTRAWNEEFLPAYGSAWVKYLGAIGILYEQASTGGTLVRQRTGTTLTFAQAVDHQFISSMTNLQTLAKNRREVLSDWARGRKEAVEAGGKGYARAYVIPPGRDPGRTARLVGTLLAHGIEIHTSEAAVRATGLRDGWSAEKHAVGLPAGSFLLRLDQPLSPLIHNLMDFHQPMTGEFLREERTWLERGKGSRLYEATAWSLPLLYGVTCYWTDTIPAGRWKKLEAGEEPAGSLDRQEARFGYLFDGDTDGAIFLTASLLERGISLRVGRETFRHKGRDYERGAFLVKKEGNPEDVGRILSDLASRFGTGVIALDSARVLTGPDFGGDDFVPIIRSRVAVLTGSPISAPSYGQIWHLLDRRMGVRFSGLNILWLRGVDLSRYNVLVFPHIWGGTEAYAGMLGKEGISKIKSWIESGGTAVGIGGGAEFLAGEKTGISRVRLRREALGKYPPVVLGLDAETAEAAGLFRGTGLRATPTEDVKKEKKESPKSAFREYATPYDVPPVVGAGASPFLERGATTFLPPRRLVRLDEWAKPIAPAGDEKTLEAFHKQLDERLRRFHPRGAFLRVDLDRELWLAYGSRGKIPVVVHFAHALVAESPVQVVGRFAGIERLHVSGLLWPEAAGRLSRTTYLTRESAGKGQVILFAGDPVYRGVSKVTRRLFLNALFLGPGLGTRWTAPW